MRILHFADAHIDTANYGRHDPDTGLPIRVLDFLKSLDTIISTGINEKVDLVLFAGDAYKDRNPSPTFQREWGKRIMRLSNAGIPTILLVGNHDNSPAQGRAHAIQEFETLEVPKIHVISKPTYLDHTQLELPLQIIAIPWIYRSTYAAALNLEGEEILDAHTEMETRLIKRVNEWVEQSDPNFPIILSAHATIQGAKYGAERSVLLGSDLVLPGSLVKDPRLDYVALGHLHKAQDLNEGNKPPVIYPGSIERVDFGEAQDKKYFVICTIEKGNSEVEWRELDQIRPFIDRSIEITDPENITNTILSSIPDHSMIKDAIIRLTIRYPREMENMIDEQAIRDHTCEAFDLNINRHPMIDVRVRLPENQGVSSFSPLELMEIYWNSNHLQPEEIDALKSMAEKIITNENQAD